MQNRIQTSLRCTYQWGWRATFIACTWRKYAVETTNCILLAQLGSTLCGECVSHTWKCVCSTGERMHKPEWYIVFCWKKCWVPKNVCCPCLCVCRFAVCERCTEIEDHLQQATSEQERRLWLHAKKIHREQVSNIVLPSLYWISCSQWHVTTRPLCVQVRTERGMYHFRSARAAASSDAMSTVIDGADQAQYGLPYFAQDDKSTTNGLKYKVWTMNCSAPGVSM